MKVIRVAFEDGMPVDVPTGLLGAAGHAWLNPGHHDAKLRDGTRLDVAGWTAMLVRLSWLF